jgi:hypothetical protein
LLLLQGCSSQSSDYATEPASGSDSSNYDRESPTAPAEPAPSEPADYASGIGFDPELIATSQHKVIYTGEVFLETLEFESSVSDIQAFVSSQGGYAESSYIEGRRLNTGSRPSRRTANFVFRIPQQRFHSFAKEMSAFGNVISASTHGDNITERYFDSEARLNSLQIQDERMLSLLERADEIEDILLLESELTNLRYQIENLTGTLQKWDNLVQYSTVRVEVQEVDEITLDSAEIGWSSEISETFRRSVIAVIRSLQDFIIFLIMALPYILIFIPLFLVGKFIYHKTRKRMGNKSSTGTDSR